MDTKYADSNRRYGYPPYYKIRGCRDDLDFTVSYFTSHSEDKKKRGDIGSGVMRGCCPVQWNIEKSVQKDTAM